MRRNRSILILAVGLLSFSLHPFSGNAQEADQPSVRILIEKGFLEQAERQLRVNLGSNPRDIESYRMLSEVFRRQNRLDEAIDAEQQITGLNPEDAEAHFWLGTYYRWKGMTQQAIAEYTRALSLDPGHADARVGRARVFLYQGILQGAENDLQVILETVPDHEEAAVLKGSTLQEKRRYTEAAQLYLSVLERNPDDQDARMGYYRVLGELKPAIDFDYSRSKTEVKEGRGDPNITVSTVEYFSDRISGKIRHRVRPDLSLQSSLAEQREKVEVLSGNFVVYDFDSLTGLLGSEYRIRPRWDFLTEMGATGYSNNQTGSVQDKTVFRYLAKVTYHDPLRMANLSVQRSPFLGRGFSSDTDFGIFAENRMMAHYEQPLNLRLRGDLEYAFAYYSDGNKIHLGTTGLIYSYLGQTLTLRYSVAPIQGRFLLKGEGRRLDFINTQTLAVTYSGLLFPDWVFAVESRYTRYEGKNQEAFGNATLTYHPHYFPIVYGGAAFTFDTFSKDAREYNNLDIYYTTLFVEFKRSLAPLWMYQLRYAHSFITDEGTAGYDSDEITGHLEYTLDYLMRLGVQGRYLNNSLDETIQSFIVYLRFLL